MNCPKCGGEAFLSDEEFVGVVENITPVKIIIKEIYVCKSCAERFSRINVMDIDAKKSEKSDITNQMPKMLENLTMNLPEAGSSAEQSQHDSVRFLDRL